ncbi:C40 family peptidase [Flavobacterium sp. SM2513]|uniref:C40 family peptidase n=1 Tax=Flavobacterium sp. SM2513 TaxID=3424766 RepID=UPI003D7FA537
MRTIKTLNLVTYILLAVVAAFVLYYTFQKKEPINAEIALAQVAVQAPLMEINLGLRDSIVAYGMEYLGTPYVTAGCSKNGFDCSGFVYFVFQHFNIEVPRSSAAFEDFGTEIPIEAVEKGDVLLFLSPTRDAIGHIGIVTEPKGMESEFIHATSGREMQVVVTPLSNDGYTRRFVKAIRVAE